MDLSNYISETNTKKSDLARALNVSPALMHQWIERIRPVAVQHCAAIEALTGGMVTRKDLRPNDWQKIWPELVVPIPPIDPSVAESIAEAEAKRNGGIRMHGDAKDRNNISK
ncbi:YdaS family helix-turn-helix protein [Herminiimonas sp. CN]|uniref:transcriptional regulator n=1 Tax=Herminiimonas sp. CN TaxID=1349818 RepID=UPI0004735B1F|nr:YdaS family helix-turn-helix protein [Herminiimonas sp. CN]